MSNTTQCPQCKQLSVNECYSEGIGHMQSCNQCGYNAFIVTDPYFQKEQCYPNEMANYKGVMSYGS